MPTSRSENTLLGHRPAALAARRIGGQREDLARSRLVGRLVELASTTTPARSLAQDRVGVADVGPGDHRQPRGEVLADLRRRRGDQRRLRVAEADREVGGREVVADLVRGCAA